MRKNLRDLLKEKIIIVDGATGTNLQKRGMPGNVCPEQWILDHPEIYTELVKEYTSAGSDLVYVPTFSANRIKLREYGLEDTTADINQRLVKLAREAAGEDVLIAGDMTMTGQQLRPLGTLSLEELLDCYKEQAQSIAKAGVDAFVIETMMSLNETRAAVLAVKEVTDLPVMVTMTFDANGRTLYGTDGVTALITLQNMGIDAFGMNCSSGPENMGPMLDKMKPWARIPLIVKANAGLPEYVDGETVFSMGPDVFAAETMALIGKGAEIVGGCCGTTPEHIKALASAVKNADRIADTKADSAGAKTDVIKTALTSERKTWFFDGNLEADGALEHIKINRMIDAGSDDSLLEDFRDGQWDTLYDIMEDIEDDEPDLICICPDGPGVDGPKIMSHIFEEMDLNVAPVAVASRSPETIEAALLHYPGRAMVICDSEDEDQLKILRAQIEKYGAVLYKGGLCS
ncbi:homocysteine S-methyltransferase family protein [Catenibacillus scindens]|uniref:homocysteine S-methyltransferase family protein n=1 Tax=Catenibacillus scindens TaxID=673271 RepID=UPI003207E758